MKIINELPPIYEDILAGGMQPTPYTLYAYGDAIYNPSGQDIPEEIIAHEKVHMKQQGDDPDYWWSRYIDDVYFRINEEIEAYAMQYNVICKKTRERGRQYKALLHYARTLAGPIYGNVIGITKAMEMIQREAKKRPLEFIRRCKCGATLQVHKQKWCSDRCQMQFHDYPHRKELTNNKKQP